MWERTEVKFGIEKFFFQLLISGHCRRCRLTKCARDPGVGHMVRQAGGKAIDEILLPEGMYLSMKDMWQKCVSGEVIYA